MFNWIDADWCEWPNTLTEITCNSSLCNSLSISRENVVNLMTLGRINLTSHQTKCNITKQMPSPNLVTIDISCLDAAKTICILDRTNDILAWRETV